MSMRQVVVLLSSLTDEGTFPSHLLAHRIRRIHRIHRATTNTMATVISLPTDVLELIWKFALDKDPDIAPKIGGVSRAWRQGVNSRPELWSHCVFNPSRPGPKFDLWKERSKGKITTLRMERALERGRQVAKCLDFDQVIEHVKHVVVPNWPVRRETGVPQLFSNLTTLTIAPSLPFDRRQRMLWNSEFVTFAGLRWSLRRLARPGQTRCNVQRLRHE